MRLPLPSFRRSPEPLPYLPPSPPPPTKAEQAEAIIQSYTESAGFAGVPGAFVPHLDTLALFPMWATMIYRLAKCYELTLSFRDSLKISAAVIGSAGTFYAGVKVAGWYFSLTGVGVVPVAAMNVSLNAALTYAAGQAAAKVFSRQDLDPRDLIAMIIREFIKLLPTARLPGLGAARVAT